jgi:hypothetical protein
MQIDCNGQDLKHDSSIRFNRDSDSNVIWCSIELQSCDGKPVEAIASESKPLSRWWNKQRRKS